MIPFVFTRSDDPIPPKPQPSTLRVTVTVTITATSEKKKKERKERKNQLDNNDTIQSPSAGKPFLLPSFLHSFLPFIPSFVNSFNDRSARSTHCKNKRKTIRGSAYKRRKEKKKKEKQKNLRCMYVCMREVPNSFYSGTRKKKKKKESVGDRIGSDTRLNLPNKTRKGEVNSN